jgi:hypothetical protein
MSSSSSSFSPPRARWTRAEDELVAQSLRAASAAEADEASPAVAALAERLAAPHARSPAEIAERWRGVLRVGLRKGPWSAAEDAVVVAQRAAGVTKWSAIAAAIGGRTGKQCRERWLNSLDPVLVTSPWGAGEDALLDSLVASLGTSWKAISASLPGRSENGCKNRWHSRGRPAVFSSASAAAAAMLASAGMGAGANAGAQVGAHAGATCAGAGAMPMPPSFAGCCFDAATAFIAGAAAAVAAAGAGAVPREGVGADDARFVCRTSPSPALAGRASRCRGRDELGGAGSTELEASAASSASASSAAPSLAAPSLAAPSSVRPSPKRARAEPTGIAVIASAGAGEHALRDWPLGLERLDISLARPRPRHAAQAGALSPSCGLGAQQLLALSAAKAAALSPRASDAATDPDAAGLAVSPHLQQQKRAVAPSRPLGASPSER